MPSGRSESRDLPKQVTENEQLYEGVNSRFTGRRHRYRKSYFSLSRLFPEFLFFLVCSFQVRSACPIGVTEMQRCSVIAARCYQMAAPHIFKIIFEVCQIIWKTIQRYTGRNSCEKMTSPTKERKQKLLSRNELPMFLFLFAGQLLQSRVKWAVTRCACSRMESAVDSFACNYFFRTGCLKHAGTHLSPKQKTSLFFQFFRYLVFFLGRARLEGSRQP